MLLAVTVPAPPAAKLATRMVTLARPLASVKAVPVVGENTANASLVAKLTTEFGTGFLFASSTVALTVSGAALDSELVGVPLAFTNSKVTVAEAGWASEGNVVVLGGGLVTPRLAHKPGMPLTQLSELFPLFPPPHALKAILVHTKITLDLMPIIVPFAVYMVLLAKSYCLSKG